MSKVLKNIRYKQDCKVALIYGDITDEDSEAIVNAANSYLMHGGGVAGAIVRRGGRVIQDESNSLAPIPVGSAVSTSAGDLEAKYVIHTVGPKWGEGDEVRKLSASINSALMLAEELTVKSISLPAVSTGIFGFPVEIASDIILAEIKNYINSGSSESLQEIRICLFDENVLNVFLRKWDATFSLAETI